MKTKAKIFKKKAQNNFRLLILFSALILVAVLIVGNVMLNFNSLPDIFALLMHSNPVPVYTTPHILPTPTDLPEEPIDASLVNKWKTYTNTTYRFQVTYPALGTNFRKIIECGKYISEGKSATYTNINNQTMSYKYFGIDSFYSLIVITYSGTLHDYIYSQDNNVANEYTLIPITDVNADEAIEFKVNDQTTTAKTQQGNSPLSDMAPFGHTLALYRKGNYIFDLGRGQAPGYGCEPLYQLSNSENEIPHNPSDQKLIHEIFLQNNNWNVARSLKFL